jgi:hypothetical protein
MPLSTPFAGERDGAGPSLSDPGPDHQGGDRRRVPYHAVRVSGTRRTGATVRRAPFARAA